MIDHLGINCADLDAAKSFYDSVLAPLGYGRVMDFGVACGYGVEGAPAFWLSSYDDMPATQREVHVAFRAPDVAAVHAFHEAAVAVGAEVLHAPRPFPEYHPGYYGVFMRDLDGNNIEAVTHDYVAEG
ncbi:VOC family protein [Nocardioides sp. LHD-245]|uniref:VOC family protein n=1 Tax=Nocardioides sp. LHD-245 TaxID=3051387 RepID=UPI0027E15432|nr:VOC family protein [Nocardioides sp. LHD-245]